MQALEPQFSSQRAWRLARRLTSPCSPGPAADLSESRNVPPGTGKTSPSQPRGSSSSHSQSSRSTMLFEVSDLVYRYPDGSQALAGANLSIAKGDRIAILGANGSGKSTLLRMLDGL